MTVPPPDHGALRSFVQAQSDFEWEDFYPEEGDVAPTDTPAARALAALTALEAERDEWRDWFYSLEPSADGGYGPDCARTWKDAYIARWKEGIDACNRADAAEARVAEVESERDRYREALRRAEMWPVDVGRLASVELAQIKEFIRAALAGDGK